MHLRLLILTVCALLMAGPVLGAPPTASVPLDSWAYPALDKLAGLGLIDSALQGSRPYTRSEVARQLQAARVVADQDPPPAVVAELLRRLEDEFAADLAVAASRLEPPAHFILTSGAARVDPRGRLLYFPKQLTNTDQKDGLFDLEAFFTPDGTSLPVLHADWNGDGTPDDDQALQGPVLLAPGESFAFVVALPRPEFAEVPGINTVTVAATSLDKPLHDDRYHILRETRIDYLYREGDKSFYPGTDARQFPLSYNNHGDTPAEGHNLRLTFSGDVRLGDHLLFDVRPFVEWGEGDGADLRLQHGTVVLGCGPLELSAGRQALWWGPGRHGSLVLTNNARPLDMVRLTNPQPAVLPGFLGYLGPFRFDLFVSELEHDRVVPDPYFSGLRLNFRPAPWLEVGLSRTATFGGDGRPDVDFDDFLTIIGGENLGGDEDTSNQVASVDARLLLPFLWNAELYGELGGEDEAGGFIAKKAYLAGLYLPQLEPSGRLALRLEYANLDADRAGTLWYTHGIYRSGYVYEGQILGHHAGGDATDFYAELQAFLPRDVTVTASIDIEERGRAGAVQEEHTQPALALNLALPDGLSLELAYAWDRVRNFGFTDGDDRDFHLLQVGMAKRW